MCSSMEWLEVSRLVVPRPVAVRVRLAAAFLGRLRHLHSPMTSWLMSVADYLSPGLLLMVALCIAMLRAMQLMRIMPEIDTWLSLLASRCAMAYFGFLCSLCIGTSRRGCMQCSTRMCLRALACVVENLVMLRSSPMVPSPALGRLLLFLFMLNAYLVAAWQLSGLVMILRL